MSGFFSLGGNNKQHQEQQQQTDTNNSSLLLFKNKNEEIYNKGFELWQQYYHHHHHRSSLHGHPNNINTQGMGFSVGPSSNTGGDDSSSNYSYRSAAGFRVTTTTTAMMRGGRGSSGSEGMNCQDCGNQAKKDCSHMRCRTCCKSRGFQCQTHVKSTWVPAAKRRERQQIIAAAQQDDQSIPKRLREYSGGGGGGSGGGALACTGSRLPATTSGFELGHFPPEVSSPAVFRCVRVSAMDDTEEHLAYHTAVNIGGHVFKGILYDQGPEIRYTGGGKESSSAIGSQQHQPLDLIAGASTSGANATTSNMTMLDYPTPLTAFMAGTQFFPPPRP